MKLISILALSLITFNSFAWTMEAETVCGSPEEDSAISAGTDGVINSIHSLRFKFDQKGPSLFKLGVNGVTATDSANGDDTAKSFTEIYKVKEMKSGTMMELEGLSRNQFNFDAVFLELGDMDVITAGPVPEGTFNQKVSLALIDSNIYYKNPSPMTVRKFVFNCKTSIKYFN